MANKMNSTKVVTGVVRLSYANVWEPASINGSNPKYSVSLIIPKSDKQTLDAINAAVDGLPEISLGDVLGSNVVNIALVLAVNLLIAGVTGNPIRRSFSRGTSARKT